MCAYPIIHVPDDASDDFEAMGTKEKFWFRRANDERWLFKCGRPGTGEDWAEKAACELADVITLPHAQYELATWRERNGVVTPSFLSDALHHPGMTCGPYHGNELLLTVDPTYPQDANKRYKVSEHTFEKAIGVIGSLVGLDFPVG